MLQLLSFYSIQPRYVKLNWKCITDNYGWVRFYDEKNQLLATRANTTNDVDWQSHKDFSFYCWTGQMLKITFEFYDPYGPGSGNGCACGAYCTQNLNGMKLISTDLPNYYFSTYGTIVSTSFVKNKHYTATWKFYVDSNIKW